ncbi:MAG: CDP-alcohol phosphatidyltransferase family protein [Clostridia bacterium]
MRITKKSIPNILSFIRLLLVPVFAVLFFAEIKNAHFWALLVFLIAGLTDVVDGYLARKNNWITDLGKLLDPMADKLMQFAAFVCLAIKNNFLIWLAILIAVKEILFIAGGGIFLKKYNFVVSSLWYGKMATCVLTFTVCVMLIFGDSPTIVLSMSIAAAGAMIFALVMYPIHYINQKNISRKG